MKIGQLIKELRQKKGLTQDELATKTDISVRTIQRIENDEVDPRAYTLQSLAVVLEVDYETLATSQFKAKGIKGEEDSKWLPILHLSGLMILVVPPILIWILNRNEVEGIKKHAVDVINFQLSMTVYSIPLALFQIYPIVIILFIYSQILIILNTMKVSNDDTYKYPLSIKFLKFSPIESLSVS